MEGSEITEAPACSCSRARATRLSSERSLSASEPRSRASAASWLAKREPKDADEQETAAAELGKLFEEKDRDVREAAAAALKNSGARKVVAYCTHPVLSGPAIRNLEGSQLDELVVTDTIALSEAAKACAKIRQLSVAELLGETIRRIAFGKW